MKSIKSRKAHGNNGLTKEFYETFWDELKTPLLRSINPAFHTKPLIFRKDKLSSHSLRKKTGINKTKKT